MAASPPCFRAWLAVLTWEVVAAGVAPNLRGLSDAWSGCTEKWEDCQQSRCCSDQKYTCYEKHQWYAQCRESCVEGVHEDEAVDLQEPWTCRKLSSGSPSPPPSEAPAPSPPSGAPTPGPPPHQPSPKPGVYSLDMEAQGHSFFENFDFLTNDGNHGASHYMSSYQEAKDGNVAQAYGSHAVLRAGARSQHEFKRTTAKIATKKSWKHFLAVMKFNHVPWGCGVWPAFFTLGTGEAWPMGGEMDILEYVNDQGSMTSFHTGKECVLDSAQVNKYRHMPDSNFYMNNNSNYNCLTQYCATCTSLGCAPNTMPLLTGEQWSNHPGVIAMERTAEFTKIFFIPEHQIPRDLSKEGGTPNPKEWDRWIISYYPFGSSPGCPDPDNVMAPQQFILSIAFCGDWASKVWGSSTTCPHVGPKYNKTASEGQLPIDAVRQPGQCRAVDPLAEYAPQEDCCTQFIYDKNNTYDTDAYLNERAFFNISWLKVFT